MTNFTKVATTTDIPAGSLKTVHILGKMIAIANVDGQYFAVDDLCTHKECSLGSTGFLDGNVITCGCHGAKFDASNGKVQSLPATQDLKTYAVKIEGNDIYVGLA